MYEGNGRLRALVCDDDPATRLLAGRTLSREFPDIAVDTAASPAEALAMLKSAAYDLVIADYHFPSLKTGVDVLEASLRDCPGAMRFLVTGRPDLDIVRDGLGKARIHGVLVKGVDAAEFAEGFGTLVRRFRAAERA